MKPIVYAVDPGSLRKQKFGWASSRQRQGSHDISELVSDIYDDLSASRKVAMGFECPLFVPCPSDPSNLGKARKGEDKAFSASPGACATMTGLPAMGWVLREIGRRHPRVRATTRWPEFQSQRFGLLLWEALVTGKDKGASDIDDAQRALEAFEKNLNNPDAATCVRCESPISFAGALVLWAGLGEDTSVLREAALVLRP